MKSVTRLAVGLSVLAAGMVSNSAFAQSTPDAKESTHGIVTMSGYACAGLAPTLVVNPGQDAYVDCTPADGSFVFVRTSDGSGETINGSTADTAIYLAPGTYDVTETNSGATVTITVEAGQSVDLARVVTAQQAAPTQVAKPTQAPATTAKSTTPSKLPKTGAGVADDASVIAIAGVAAAAAAGSGFLIRRRNG